MRSRLLPVLFALVLGIAACSNGADDPGGNGAADETPPTSTADEGSADLADDVAATVDGDEIAVEDLEQEVELLLSHPEVEAQAAQGDRDQVVEAVRAQSLSTLIAFLVLDAGAQELGLEPTDADVTSARDELAEAAGGETQFEERLEESGLSEEQVNDQLRALATLNLVGERLLEESEQPEPQPGDGELSESEQRQQLAQQWLAERLATADIVVNRDLGRWDATAGQVVPPSADGPAPNGN